MKSLGIINDEEANTLSSMIDTSISAVLDRNNQTTVTAPAPTPPPPTAEETASRKELATRYGI